MADATEPTLLDLDLPQLTALMAELDQPPWRARQVWRQVWQRGVLDPLEMSDLPPLAARAAGAAQRRRAHAAANANQRGRLNHQGAVAAGRRRADRDGANPPRPARADQPHPAPHRLPFDPGRLRDGLHLLRHRRAGLPPPAVGRRGARAGSAGPRLGPRGGRRAVPRRLHGHGRAAGQLRNGQRGAGAALRRRRLRALAAPYHGLNGRPAGADTPPGRRPPAGQSGREPARCRRGSAARTGARAPRVARRDHRRRPRALPAHRPPRHIRIRAAGGRKRLPRQARALADKSPASAARST